MRTRVVFGRVGDTTRDALTAAARPTGGLWQRLLERVNVRECDDAGLQLVTTEKVQRAVEPAFLIGAAIRLMRTSTGSGRKRLSAVAAGGSLLAHVETGRRALRPKLSLRPTPVTKRQNVRNIPRTHSTDFPRVRVPNGAESFLFVPNRTKSTTAMCLILLSGLVGAIGIEPMTPPV